MNHPRPFRLVLLIVIFLSAVAGCGEKAEKKPTPTSDLSPRLEEIRKAGKLVIGTAITRPFEYHDPETDRLVGFDVSLMEQIAARLGVELEWKEMVFADLLGELQADNLDVVIAGMYIRPDREEIIDFTQPYLDTGLVMVVQADTSGIDTFEDLAGHTVGVKEKATGETWAKKLHDEDGIALEIRTYTDTLESLDDLDAGLIDVVFNDRINTLEYIKTHPNIRIQGEVFDPAGLGIAVQTGDTELLQFIDGVLTEFKANGTLDDLFEEWISAESAP